MDEAGNGGAGAKVERGDMSKLEIITIQYDVWNEDVTERSPLPMPNVGLFEVLSVEMIDGIWEVRSTRPEDPKAWIGRGENRQGAILDYLKARLGLREG